MSKIIKQTKEVGLRTASRKLANASNVTEKKVWFARVKELRAKKAKRAAKAAQLKRQQTAKRSTKSIKKAA